MKRFVLPSALAALAMTAQCADAQALKSYEHSTVGVRMSIPATWKWDDRPREAFVNCAPDRVESGRPGCYFIVRKWKAAPDQRAISDDDRKNWLESAGDHGRQPILSSRDIKVAGFPAFEVVLRSGPRADDWIGSMIWVLVPGKGEGYRIMYNTILDPADHERFKPAVMKALQTLTPTP